ncbi:uncharacterized protein LOC144883434 [Branchiostoma floridae x Branchiostoma japonicum]
MPRRARDHAVESSPEVGSEEEKFPEKLWRLAKDAKIKCIQWVDGGDTILIYQKSFSQELLNKKEFFKTKSFDSIVRNLNLYGFRKVQLDGVIEQSSKRARKPSGDNLLYYKHPFFHRDKPDTLHQVRRPSCSKSAVAERRRCRLVQALTALRANLPDDEDKSDLGQLLNTIGGGDAPPTAEPAPTTPRKKPPERKTTTPSSTDARKKSTSKKRPRGRLQSVPDAAEDKGSVACMQKMTITPIENPDAALRDTNDLQIDETLEMEVDAEVTFPSCEPEAAQTVPASSTSGGDSRQDLYANHCNVTPYLGDSSLHHNDPFGGSYYPLGESDSTWCHGVPPQCYGDDHVVSCTLPNRQWAWQAYGDHLGGYPYAWPAPYHTTTMPHGWNSGADQVPVPYQMRNNGGEHPRQDTEPATVTVTPLSTVDVAAIASNSPGVSALEASPTILTVL